jgi:hypothetical protein
MTGASAESDEKLGFFADLLQFVLLFIGTDTSRHDAYNGLRDIHFRFLTQLTKQFVIYQGCDVDKV